MKALVPVAASAVLLLAAPATASADSIFAPSDAEILAKMLSDANDEQGVCYGWDVDVNDRSSYSYSSSSSSSDNADSVGSDQGVGVPVDESCDKYVRLDVNITWTSATSESEDSASWDVDSSPGGPTRSDMEALGLNLDGLAGENPDVPIGEMIMALPLLAADEGMAPLVEATPATAEPASNARLTDDPGSDWWRGNGGMFLWGMGILLAGGIFAWWVMRANRGREQLFPSRAQKTEVPDTVPSHFNQSTQPEPPTEPFPAAEPKPPYSAGSSWAQERPTDQNDKE